MKKINMKKHFITLSLIILTGISSVAQVGIGTDTPDVNAILELSTSNKGLLLPRVSLTGTTDIVTVGAATVGMTVYNTAEVSDVTPGIYYNNGTIWLKASTENKTFFQGLLSNDINVNAFIGSNTGTIPFDNVSFDINTEYDQATSSIVVKQAGIYDISAQVSFKGDTNSYYTEIYLEAGQSVMTPRQNNNESIISIPVHMLAQLNTGDAIKVKYRVDTNDNGTYNLWNNANATRFSVHQVK